MPKCLTYISVFTKCRNKDLEKLQNVLMSGDDYNTSIVGTKLISLNRRVQSIPGDENCLFSAVADQFMNHPTQPLDGDHKLLCFMVVQYLRNNKEQMEVKYNLFLVYFIIMNICTLMFNLNFFRLNANIY